MGFSTPVDNFVPYQCRDVDNPETSAAAVENPVNDAVESRISTGLSTLLITYRDVVHAPGEPQIPCKPGIPQRQPTTFSPPVDNLWVGGCC
jgi:hypothetical protein